VPADLVAIATLMVLATLAPVTAWRRRLATPPLRRRLRAQPPPPHRPRLTGRVRGLAAEATRQVAAPARAGSVTRTAVTAVSGGVRRPRAARRSRASSTARV
jgi:hypothetical protein